MGNDLTDINSNQNNNNHHFKWVQFNHTNNSYVNIKHFTINSNHHSQILSSLYKRSKLQNQFILKCFDIKQHPSESHRMISVMFQLPFNNLRKQLEIRKVQGNNFSEQQIWSILATSIIGFSYYSKKKIHNNFLQLEQLRVNQQGLIQVIDQWSYNFVFDKKQVRSKNQQVNKDLYNLGIIILQLGLLKNLEHLYYQDFRIIDLSIYVQLMEKKYSKEIIEMFYMLTNSKKRPQWIQLQQFVIENKDQKSQRSTHTFAIQSENKNLIITQDENKKTQSQLERSKNLSQIWINQNSPQLRVFETSNQYKINFNQCSLVNKDINSFSSDRFKLLSDQHKILSDQHKISLNQHKKFQNAEIQVNFNESISSIKNENFYKKPSFSVNKMNKNYSNQIENIQIQKNKKIKTKVQNNFKSNVSFNTFESQINQQNQQFTSKYSGQLKNYKFHGFGILINEQLNRPLSIIDYINFSNIDLHWTKYQGQFENGLMNGKGKIYFINGQVFKGFWKMNRINGYGTFINNEGKYLLGKWINNKLIETFQSTISN